MAYYIHEIQTKPDGSVNVIDTASRSTLPLALAEFHNRLSKACGSTQFASVSVDVTDSNLKQLRHTVTQTSYVPPVENEE